YRACKSLFDTRSGYGGTRAQGWIQLHQHCPAACGSLFLELLFPRRISRWPRRRAGPDDPCSLCELEIRQGMGDVEKTGKITGLISKTSDRKNHLGRAF